MKKLTIKREKYPDEILFFRAHPTAEDVVVAIETEQAIEAEERRCVYKFQDGFVDPGTTRGRWWTAKADDIIAIMKHWDGVRGHVTIGGVVVALISITDVIVHNTSEIMSLADRVCPESERNA